MVGEIREAEKSLRPKPPFTTSKLQQTAANRLGFTSKKTMQIAQQLYEGVNVGSTRIGLITYMRTDSTRISDTAIAEVRGYLARTLPRRASGIAQRLRRRRKGPGCPRGHTADDRRLRPRIIKEHLSKDQLKLYALIWERFVASQMTNAKVRAPARISSRAREIFRVALLARRRAGLLQGDQARRHQGGQGRGQVPELEARRGDQARARPSRAAFHSGALALHRRVDHQGSRGTGHRPTLDLRADHLGPARALLRLEGESPARAYDPRAHDQRYPGRVLSRRRQRRIHRRHGGDARRGRGREGRLGRARSGISTVLSRRRSTK